MSSGSKKDIRFTLRLSKELLEEYHKFCEENSITIAKRLRKFMESDIENWKKRKLMNSKNS